MSFLALTAFVVRDYDEALAFYVGMLGFELVEDTCIPEQESRIGNQTGGRVFLFLYTVISTVTVGPAAAEGRLTERPREWVAAIYWRHGESRENRT